MSKNNNVNPGQYKTKGRSRPGDDLLHDKETQEYAQSQHELAQRTAQEAQKTKSRRASRGRPAADAPPAS
ncbi:MAG: hypothetical protein AB7N91_29650 [Candidatus Tectimicrobiota bacterium]